MRTTRHPVIPDDELPRAGDKLEFPGVTGRITRVVRLDSGMVQVHYATGLLGRAVGATRVINIDPFRDPERDEAA